jgi:hypothetical protein
MSSGASESVTHYLSPLERAPTPASYPAGTGAFSFNDQVHLTTFPELGETE